MPDSNRTYALNDRPSRDGRYILYWMQRAQRARFNHALEHAIRRANDASLPLLACFGLYEAYPEANERHFAFMLDGLKETRDALAERGIRLVVRRGAPDAVAIELARDAAAVVTDAGHLRHERAWRTRVADAFAGPVEEVDGDAVVPVALASQKPEHAARTIRPKILRLRDDMIAGMRHGRPNHGSLDLKVADGVSLDDPAALLASLDLDRSVKPNRRFAAGTAEAVRRLKRFIDDRITGYADERNDPAHVQGSTLSPYLHFGQISPVEIAWRVVEAGEGRAADRDVLLEELIVRRELALNHVRYRNDYDRYEVLPDWAKATLAEHAADRREHTYGREQLEAGETHDPYWNAAMREMRVTGFMHNYMRMYWGKKILEWTPSPQDAFTTALAINNRYFLDGRDAASFANVAWCFGLHDRAWPERPIFGKVRYMNDAGLRRKFDIDRYVAWTKTLEE